MRLSITSHKRRKFAWFAVLLFTTATMINTAIVNTASGDEDPMKCECGDCGWGEERTCYTETCPANASEGQCGEDGYFTTCSGWVPGYGWYWNSEDCRNYGCFLCTDNPD